MFTQPEFLSHRKIPVVIFLFLFFSFASFVKAQHKIYSYAGNHYLYEIDLANCTSRVVGRASFIQPYADGSYSISAFIDIAVTPNGRIFALTNSNKIFELDTTNAQIINTWANTQGYSYVAALLAMDNDHLITVAIKNSGRYIASISLITGELTVIGSTGIHHPNGDLTWLNGDLYMSNYTNRLIRYHLSADLSSIDSITDVGLMNTPLKASYGLTTFRVKDCGQDSSVIYNFDGFGFYAVDPTTAAVRLVCNNITEGYGSYGAGATDEALNRFPQDSLVCPPVVVVPEPEDSSEVVEVPGTFFIPNLFTPNDDGLNDVFACSTNLSLDILMQIYNRWGDLVYEEHSKSPAWNGRTKQGGLHSSGVYYFLITTRNNAGEEKMYKGAVSLIE